MSLPATPPQISMLFRLWNTAKRRLMNGRETWTGDEERRQRHEFTKKILGREKSWSVLNRRGDVDMLKAGLLAILRPDDLNVQLRQARQKNIRLEMRLDQLLVELGKDRNYAQGIVDQMWSPDSGPRKLLAELSAEDLQKVIIALQSHKRRGGGVVKAPRTYLLHPA